MKKLILLICICLSFLSASAKQKDSTIMNKARFMQEAIDISIHSVKSGGGPFGAVVVKDGQVVAKASNSVTITNDPTAHAEVNAIRKACDSLDTFSLKGCELYTSCEPCPMCLGAAYWAGIKKIYFGNTRADAKKINFDDSFIYDQIPLDPKKRSIPSEQLLGDKAIEAFRMWEAKDDKVRY